MKRVYGQRDRLALLVATTGLCLRHLGGPAWPCLASIGVPKISGPAGHEQGHAHSDASENAPRSSTSGCMAAGRDAWGQAHLTAVPEALACVMIGHDEHDTCQ